MKSKVIASVVMLFLMFAVVNEASAGPWGRHGGYGRGYGWRPRVYYAPPIPRIIVRPPMPVVRVYPGYGYGGGGYYGHRGYYGRRGCGRRYY